MTDILQDLSPAKVIHAIEENLFAWIPVFGSLGRVSTNNPSGVDRAITDIPSALFNSVMRTRLPHEQADAAIQSIISDGRARNVPIIWWTTPSTQPGDLDKHLAKLGFTRDEDGPGMAVELAKLNQDLPAPQGFNIQLARDDASWWEWSVTMAAGFEAPVPDDFRAQAWHNLLLHADPQTMLAYTGLLNGKPVATSLLFLAAGVAGVYAVATIPEARRKGIGAHMTAQPLLQARARGYQVGVLEASEMGNNVYRSLGFEEYCRILSWRWAPEQ